MVVEAGLAGKLDREFPQIAIAYCRHIPRTPLRRGVAVVQVRPARPLHRGSAPTPAASWGRIL
jgi:hypothetical protein